MRKILTRKRFGALLRVFAKTSDQVKKNVEQVLEAAHAAEALMIDGRTVFAKILLIVPMDPSYPDCDCGETAPALRQMLPPGSRIEVHELSKGDVFCSALNYGVAKLLRLSIDYGLILSHGAKAYLREDTVGQLLDALEAGAKVAGIAIEELSQSILEGRIANTFAIWDLIALTSVGLFDLRGSQPRKNDVTAMYMRGWTKDKGDVFYARAGVEEIIPLIRLIRVYGECIAPIVPAGEARWQEPNPISDPDGYARSQNKLGTKFPRQMAHAAFENVDLTFIKGGVMQEFRLFG